MCGWALKASLASTPALSTVRANPAVQKGAPRSDVNTKGDLGLAAAAGQQLVLICSVRLAVDLTHIKLGLLEPRGTETLLT
jgi:hypothetical protein